MTGNGNGVTPTATSINIDRMIAVRDQKATEVADLQRKLIAARAELAGYDKLLYVGGLLSLPPVEKLSPVEKGKRRRKVAVKGVVMEIVQAAGRDGISAKDVIEQAAARGSSLPAESVTRFLQRFKIDGKLNSRDGLYTLA
jgi:hypothetical protein